MLNSIPKLFKLFKKIRPDIVHSHLFDDSLPVVIAAKIAGVKHRFVTKQDTAFHWFYAPKAIKYDRIVNWFATKLIAVSYECKQFIIEKEKANAQKVELIHHGIPIDKLSFATEEYKNCLIEKYNLKNKIVIGTVARLIDWKGHKILLKVAEKIVKKNPNIVFLFVGEGNLKEEIEKLIIEKQLSQNVIMAGWIEREKIPSLYSIMNIYIHAAKYEPFGFVIAEALLNGVSVLSTKTGAALDAIKHKESGYLVEYDNIEGFVSGINYLLSVDTKILGEKGRGIAKEMYNFDKMFESYISLYKKTKSTI